MKKMILGLGTIAAIGPPVAAVISCGNNSSKEITNNNNNVASIFKADLAKITDKTSNKYRDKLKQTLSGKAKGDAVNLSDLGITMDKFTDNVFSKYEVEEAYSTTTFQIKLKALLWKGDQKANKTFTVTAKAFDFSADEAKITNMTSHYNDAELTTSFTNLTVGTPIDASKLGISLSPFTDGVLVEYKAKSIYANKAIKIEAVLKGGGESTTKDFTLTANPYSFKNDIAKITDEITSSKDWKTLGDEVENMMTGELITLDQLGVTNFVFSTDTTATYKVSKVYDETTGIIGIEATLMHDIHKAKKFFFAKNKGFNFYNVVKDIESKSPITSTKDLSELKLALSSKNDGAAITLQDIGVADLQLDPKVIATYIYDKALDNLDDTNPNINLKVVLTSVDDASEKAEFTIYIKPIVKYDFSNDLAKIKDVDSSINKVGFELHVGALKKGEDIVAKSNMTVQQLLGINIPFSRRVEARYTVEKSFDSQSNKTVIKVVLIDKVSKIHSQPKFFTISVSNYHFPVVSKDFAARYGAIISNSATAKLKTNVSVISVGDQIAVSALGVDETILPFQFRGHDVKYYKTSSFSDGSGSLKVSAAITTNGITDNVMIEVVAKDHYASNPMITIPLPDDGGVLFKISAGQTFAGKQWTTGDRLFYLEPGKNSFEFEGADGKKYLYTLMGDRKDFIPDGERQKFTTPGQDAITVKTIDKADDQYRKNFNISYDGKLSESFAKGDGQTIPEAIKNLLMKEVFTDSDKFPDFPPKNYWATTVLMKKKISYLIDLFGHQNKKLKTWLEKILSDYI